MTSTQNTQNGQESKKLCVLTVHGIGFQQRPTASTKGYADVLHENLRGALRVLGSDLGNDPQRKPESTGAVYVMSAKPGTTDHEWGLKRLGTWSDANDGSISTTGMLPLTEGDEPVAHVALVYSPLEIYSPGAVSGAGTLGEAALMLGHYTALTGALRLVVGDAWAALHEHAGAASTVLSPSLRPRDDVQSPERHHLAKLLHRAPKSSGVLGVVRTLEDDVVAYVCRNNLRESIKEFVTEALRRLLARSDVGAVVVNAHSQGTVAAFDVLRVYPPESLSRVHAFVTAGSPLRKYFDLFSWGNDAGSIHVTKWLNFWDENDPVADPLEPPPTWHFGDTSGGQPGEPGLFYAQDQSGKPLPLAITDTQVDNVSNSSSGGLQAHNYWDNNKEFITKLAGLLRA